MNKIGNIEKQNTLKYYFDEIERSDLLSFKEEVELGKKIEKGDQFAFNKMVKSNLRLVIKIAKKYVTSQLELSDLIQEGNIGLIQATKKFNYRKNVKFSTYASLWIKQSIYRAIINKERKIRLPIKKEYKLRKINVTANLMFQELERMPTIKELSKKTGYKEIDIINLVKFTNNFISMDSDINEEGRSLIDKINDVTYSPETILNKKFLKKETEGVLERLKETEKEILKLRFALNTDKKETLKSIAKNLGICTETARQIEIKAMKKIKTDFSYLKDYLYY
ncbi:MAG: hypothetical protein A2Y34_15140 [Spirochaetes bacterium GWC1_27_15]|nr:MAG: hypothetical protein A2Z98_03670 [Spirochaetes bacterium GWB1_27_13]OHD21140.1 MAG: hypothetical protein A2Y34_15140 [Spirochaetes bacterium GWC1_27_15]